MNEAIIEEKLYEIIAKYVGRETVEKLRGAEKTLLMGEPWAVSAVDMVYIFLEVEKVFGIEIDSTKIMQYQFATINGIKKCIQMSYCRTLQWNDKFVGKEVEL